LTFCCWLVVVDRILYTSIRSKSLSAKQAAAPVVLGNHQENRRKSGLVRVEMGHTIWTLPYGTYARSHNVTVPTDFASHVPVGVEMTRIAASIIPSY
jgi:hypothetical protein